MVEKISKNTFHKTHFKKNHTFLKMQLFLKNNGERENTTTFGETVFVMCFSLQGHHNKDKELKKCMLLM